MQKNQVYLVRNWTLFLILILMTPLSTWSASIAGHVYDDVSDIYLESARVKLRGTDKETISDRGGYYRISGVEPGQYMLVVQVAGRPTITEPVNVANEYDEINLNVAITNEDIFELEEFVVEGSLIGTAKGLDIRRSAQDLREIVASDAFGQFTDRNPAEALQRIAGVTVESDQGEGSFVLIRGGSPDLSNIQIDGVSLATPEEDGRQVNLNLITVDQLERIELSKTWLPSQKGNVIAGTVNMITRSALGRGERYASFEAAGTWREINDEEDSWRVALTYGDVLKGENISWMKDSMAIGLQFSVNQSEDFLGSDTVTWGWSGTKDYPFQTRDNEETLFGFTLDNLSKRKFNIDRERVGGSARLEIRLSEKHEIYASMSSNRFDDTSREHIFQQDGQSLAQFYSGTQFLTLPIAEELGLDLEDPFTAKRLALGPPNPGSALTWNEAIQLGELGYDAERKLFTRGGLWGVAMRRYFNHRVKNDEIDTYQFGGEHTLNESMVIDWTAYSSEASQDSDRYQLRFSLDGLGGTSASGNGAYPLAGPGVENPYIYDPADNPAIFNPGSFKMREPTTPNVGPGVRLHNLDESHDERQGYEINLEAEREVSNAMTTFKMGFALDERDKSYEVDQNYYGLDGVDSLDPEFWPNRNRQASLDDEFFYGGEIEGFEDNFGSELKFGPSFDEDNTLAFLKDPESYGAVFSQNEDQMNDNFTSRVRLNYEATEDVAGFYMQESVEWRKWTFILGARYEDTSNSFTNLQILTRNPDLPSTIKFIRPGFWRIVANTEYGEEGFSEETTFKRDYHHMLPALHVIRKIGDNMVIRSSVTKTIARPKFTDLVPREIPSIDGSNFGTSLQLPAFDLEPMESINYDLSFDYFLEPVGIFSMAVFYKDLEGPIYNETRYEVGPDAETAEYAEKYTSTGLNDSSWTLSRMRNSGAGKIQGVELTFNRQFNFLPYFLNGLGLHSNFAWFDSEATLTTDLRDGEKVPLFKQPDITANVSLYYEKHGLFARLSYNYRGEYLYGITAGRGSLQQLEIIGVPQDSFDEYIEGTGRVDFTMRYKIFPSLQIFFEAINLTNEPVVRSYKHESLPVFKQYTERIFTVGVKWNL